MTNKSTFVTYHGNPSLPPSAPSSFSLVLTDENKDGNVSFFELLGFLSKIYMELGITLVLSVVIFMAPLYILSANR